MAKAEAKGAAKAEAGAEDAPLAVPQTSGRKRLIFIALAAVLLLLAAGGGLYVSGAADSLVGKSAETAEAAAPPPVPEPVFHALPDLLVSLNTGERRSTFLKVKVSLELANAADQARIERLQPRIVDYCQVYLRELRLDDLRGSAGTVRLRQELLRRIAAAVAPIPVSDVLLSDMVIQ